jgi:hypothetical protein
MSAAASGRKAEGAFDRDGAAAVDEPGERE